MNVVIPEEEFSLAYNSALKLLKPFLIADTNTEDQKLNAIAKFSEKFTVIPSLFANLDCDDRHLELALSQLLDNVFDWNIRFSKLLCKSMNQHFISWTFHVDFVKTCKWEVEKSKLYLQFPNSALAKYYEFYHRFSSSPLPKEIEEQYRQSLSLYKKIKDSESDNEKWLERVKETNDLNFIIHNIEFRIGGRPGDKEMWKIYIEFLRNAKLIDLMYHTYSRYCSLFTNDLQMREKFKTEIQNEQSASDDIVLKWKLLIVKIEKNFGTNENAISLFNKYFSLPNDKMSTENFEIEFQKMWTERSKIPSSLHILNEKLIFPGGRKSKKCIFKNDAMKQNFSLPTTLIYSMTKRAKYQHLHKLYSSSKYFFTQLRSPLCNKLMIGFQYEPTKLSTFQQNLYISSTANSILDAIKKLYVGNVLHLQTTCPKLISSIIRDKIYKCQISTLSLLNQRVHIEDFIKIISNVQNFFAERSFIFDDEGKKLGIQEILPKMPSIKKAELRDFSQDPPANSQMPKMESKLEHFFCHLFSSPFAIICQFLTASLTENASANIGFSCNPDEVEQAKICIESMFETWKSDESFKPNVKIAFNSNVYSFP